LIRNVSLKKYTGKVYSLLLSNFRYVLLVDADCMPTQDPSSYFNSPRFISTGNLFWPDAWQGTVRGDAFDSVGLVYSVAREVIKAGKGFLPRDTESGQLLLDRARHLDVLEYLFWINGERKGGESLWGDKDTYGLSFACAGKAHLFSQVEVPPSGIFAWRKDMLLEKETNKRYWGWQLMGFLQHDSQGKPAFIHRTINKWHPESDPWKLELISAPMPIRWAEYYLAHENPGPTRGVPYDYVVPSSSFSMLATIPYDDNPMLVDRCPVFSFTALWSMLEAALPVHIPISMKQSCMSTLKVLLGDSYQTYVEKGWIERPQMKYLDGPHLTSEVELTESNPLHSYPIPAYAPDGMDPADPFLCTVKASYDAFYLIKSNIDGYPILKRRQDNNSSSALGGKL
jgi:hypothetical protein